MSDDFVYSATPPASQKIEKGLKGLAGIFGLIIIGVLVWFFGIGPCMPLSKKAIDVHGFPGFDGPDVLNYAGILEGASFISINAVEVEKLLSGHYLVESARVLKHFPDRLSVFLEPRRTVALALADVNDRVLPLSIDRHGVIFSIGNGRGEALPEKLPIISGFSIKQPNPGMRLPAAFMSLFSEIGKIEAENPNLLGAVSEIRIIPKTYGGFDLMLYPVHNPIRVRLGNHINEETLSYVLLVLDVFKSKSLFPEEIDFRSGIGAYKAKEAHSGE